MGEDTWKYIVGGLVSLTGSIGLPALWKAYFQNKTDEATLEANKDKKEKDELKAIIAKQEEEIERQKEEIDANQKLIHTLQMQQGLLIASVDMLIVVIEGELESPNTLAAISKVKQHLHSIEGK